MRLGLFICVAAVVLIAAILYQKREKEKESGKQSSSAAVSIKQEKEDQKSSSILEDYKKACEDCKNQRIEEALSFAKRFGGDRASAEQIVNKIIDTVSDNDFYNGKMTVDEDAISFFYEFGCHSFFDDGGGYRESKRVILESIGENTAEPESSAESNDAEILHDPFGLKGYFSYYYHYFYESE